ncbi:MAG: hypothetical protein JO079_05470 [Frankiaceae bacterium]|nr:hypothetical protein [Frankiaceae bacterium]MBV9368963.1 hypothetical protein [Frankiales bacterium]
MRRLMVGVVVVASGLGSAYAPAQAATRLACGLVSDAPGDTTAGPTQAQVPTNEPSLDIVSADVSVNSVWVTTAVKVKKLTLGAGPLPDMWRWSMSFTSGATTYVTHARTAEGGVFGEVNVVHSVGGDDTSWFESFVTSDVLVTLDEQRSQIRVSVKRSALDRSGGVAVGDRLSNLRAYTWHEHTANASLFTQPGGEYDIADTATSAKTYVAGTRSCVKPGS